MPKNSLADLPEVFVSNAAITTAVSRAVAKGALRQIGPKLYTSNLTDPPETIVRRHLWPLVAAYVPGALIVDRTALESRPAADGSIFVIADRKRDITLPGITIRSRQGAGPLDSDRPFVGGLLLSSTPRGWLDNMAPSRRRSGEASRTLSRDELERRLDDVVRRNGMDGLNAIRDEARRIAPLLGRDSEYEALDRMVGALLGTREDRLKTDRAKARGSGKPFDPDRIALFEALHSELRATAPVLRTTAERSVEGRATLAFFEAYFSNFIEGTEFEVDQAADIVFNNAIPADRPEDAHDVLGTWQIVSDPVEMVRTPRDPAMLLALMQSRQCDADVGASRQASWPSEDRSQQGRADIVRRARSGRGNAGARLRLLPKPRHAVRARGLHDVPDFRSASVRRWQRQNRAHHDECRTGRGWRGTDHHPDGVPW